jgi:hypothetical protein
MVEPEFPILLALQSQNSRESVNKNSGENPQIETMRIEGT